MSALAFWLLERNTGFLATGCFKSKVKSTISVSRLPDGAPSVGCFLTFLLATLPWYSALSCSSCWLMVSRSSSRLLSLSSCWNSRSSNFLVPASSVSPSWWKHAHNDNSYIKPTERWAMCKFCSKAATNLTPVKLLEAKHTNLHFNFCIIYLTFKHFLCSAKAANSGYKHSELSQAAMRNMLQLQHRYRCVCSTCMYDNTQYFR